MLHPLSKEGDTLEMRLSDLQLDALREVGNIGSGNAATALSQLLGRKINMQVPRVDVLLFNDMLQNIGNEEDPFVAVLLKVFGDAPGNILFMMKYEKAQELSKVLLEGFGEVTEELYTSVFQEIGNILGNSYINAISKLTGLNLVSSVPSVAIDMLSAVLSASFMDAEQFSDYVLVIDTNFIENIEGLNDVESGGVFLYIPKPGSLNKILSNLGL
jgi:chemotaxis protein CheC